MSRNRTIDLQALFAQALAAHRAGQLERAANLYREVLNQDGRQPAPLHLLGVIEGQRGNLAEGIRYIEKAIKLDPDVADAWLNLGRMQGETGELEKAEQSLKKSLSLNPTSALAYSNLAAVYRNLKRLDDALSCTGHALAIEPHNQLALVNRGNILLDLRRFEEALPVYQKVLSLNRNLAEAWHGVGEILYYSGKKADVFPIIENILAIDPSYSRANSMIIGAKQAVADWKDLSAFESKIIANIRTGQQTENPFIAMTIGAVTSADLLSCATQHATRFGGTQPAPSKAREPHDRVRVAYLSADFHDHATAALLTGVLEHHDKSRFETIAVSFGSQKTGAMRERLQRAVDRFLDIEDKSDAEIVRLMDDLQIDIAIDLKGYTQDARSDLFARRPAPIQVNYLGYPGTMGAPFIDYIIGDKTVIPESDQKFYMEKVVWLPDSYQPNDNTRPVPELTGTRTDFGLPADGFVFCCFNNTYKVSPDAFDVWMRLLQQTEGSVLWLFEANAEAKANLRKEAEARGVAGERLIFAPRVDNADHLGRHRLADLFLDTLYYNAHTTASDALWAGLPVLTCEGQTFSSRVASSLLRAVGLPELVTTSLEDYEALALKLAHDPVLLASIKAKLATNRLTAPLFDTVRYTRYLEAAYLMMHERWQSGEPPASFAVEAPSVEVLPG